MLLNIDVCVSFRHFLYLPLSHSNSGVLLSFLVNSKKLLLMVNQFVHLPKTNIK